MRRASRYQEEAAQAVRQKTVRFKCRCRYCKLFIDPGTQVYYEPCFGAIHVECFPFWLKRHPVRPDSFWIDLQLELRAIGG
jgi:hypothetical protein